MRNPDAVAKVPKDVYECIDGPFKGHSLLLASGQCTLPLIYKGRKGRYVKYSGNLPEFKWLKQLTWEPLDG